MNKIHKFINTAGELCIDMALLMRKMYNDNAEYYTEEAQVELLQTMEALEARVARYTEEINAYRKGPDKVAEALKMAEKVIRHNQRIIFYYQGLEKLSPEEMVRIAHASIRDLETYSTLKDELEE